MRHQEILQAVLSLVLVGIAAPATAQKSTPVTVVNPKDSPALVSVVNPDSVPIPVSVTNVPQVVITEPGTRFHSSWQLQIPSGSIEAAVKYDGITITLSAISISCTGNVPISEVQVAAASPDWRSSATYFFAPDQHFPGGPWILPYTQTRIPDVCAFYVRRSYTTGTTTCTLSITGYRS